MFSVDQKRDISDAVQKILRATQHAELPTTGEVSFTLHVDGAEDWSWADIKNNGAVGDPGINPHNELMASIPEEEGQSLIGKAKALTGQTPYMSDTPSLSPIMDLQQRVTAEFDQLKSRLSLVEGKADGLISRLDHREKTNTPDDHLREIVENKWLDLETRLSKLGERDKINRKLYAELRFGLDTLQEFLTPIIEDNLIQHHSEQLENLATAIGQLGSPKVTGGD